AATYTAIGCPTPLAWTNGPPATNPFGYVTLVAGDTLVVPAGCQVTLTGTVTIAVKVTVLVQGTLYFNNNCNLVLNGLQSVVTVDVGGVLSGANPTTSGAEIKIGGVSQDVWKIDMSGIVGGGGPSGFNLGGVSECYFLDATNAIVSDNGGVCPAGNILNPVDMCAQTGAISIYTKCLKTVGGVAGQGCSAACNYSAFAANGYQMCNLQTANGNCANGRQRMGILFNIPSGCSATVTTSFMNRPGCPNSGFDTGDTMRVCTNGVCLIAVGLSNSTATLTKTEVGPSTITVAGSADRSDEIITYSFSKTGMCAGGCAVLPVSFFEISGSVANDKAFILWSTASEVNNNYFTIEKSTDAIHYMEIGRVDGAGNSHEKKDYSYSFDQEASTTLYVRIKQTDYDGKYTYSNTIVTNTNTPRTDIVFTLAPNPVINELVLNSTYGVIENVTINNLLGKEVLRVNTIINSSIID
ncbi:MAG: hypothetical protein ABL940_13740, partial [Bacteroidia bacterium]